MRPLTSNPSAPCLFWYGDGDPSVTQGILVGSKYINVTGGSMWTLLPSGWVDTADEPTGFALKAEDQSVTESTELVDGSVQVNSGNKTLLSAIYNPATTVSIRKNSSQFASASSGASFASSTRALAVGSYTEVVTQAFGGTIHEIVIYNRPLAAADITRVEAYLTRRWGIA